MSKVRDMAQKLLEAERGYRFNPYQPFERPLLSEMWPAEQGKYIRMAEKALIPESTSGETK